MPGLFCSGLADCLVGWLAGWLLKDDTININKFIKNFYFANYLLTNDEIQLTFMRNKDKKKVNSKKKTIKLLIVYAKYALYFIVDEEIKTIYDQFDWCLSC